MVEATKTRLITSLTLNHLNTFLPAVVVLNLEFHHEFSDSRIKSILLKIHKKQLFTLNPWVCSCPISSLAEQ